MQPESSTGILPVPRASLPRLGRRDDSRTAVGTALPV